MGTVERIRDILRNEAIEPNAPVEKIAEKLAEGVAVGTVDDKAAAGARNAAEAESLHDVAEIIQRVAVRIMETDPAPKPA